ncbi:MAG: putative transcriptional regulator [Candidatus Binataceae bacterium]|jgi:putative transcriptional regulator|nr:putative transcriptional regulator [Candidatus Binataceae bacterium]
MRRSAIELVLLTALIAASLPCRATFAAGARSYFLVATPQMGDPIFGGSVIMMVPTIDAPLLAGVIINKPTGTSAQEVFPHFHPPKGGPNNAYFGGPVDNGQAILALRASHPPAKAIQVFDDVYVSADAETIAQIVKDNTDPANLRIFLGRAQWLNEQLHTEIMAGAWYVVPADAAQVFDADPTHLWRKLIERGELQEVRLLLPFALLDTF